MGAMKTQEGDQDLEFGNDPELQNEDSCRDYEYGVNYSSSNRKAFLRSYPLLWEKEMEERLTLLKTLQRRVKNVVARILLLKKLKRKIADNASFVGSCSSRSLKLRVSMFEPRSRPESLSHVVAEV